jgi:hypothetical protein
MAPRKATKEPGKPRRAKPASKAKTGRKSKCTPERMKEIGRRLGEGEPLTSICADLKLCDDTVRNWMDKDEAVSRVIARAREEGSQAIAYRVRQTARGAGDSTGDVQRDKLIIDTDLKLLSKWDPKRYGDKVDVNHGGAVSYTILTGVDGGLDGG